jgi:glycosyltransferase involved in cell wall biosynthesis
MAVLEAFACGVPVVGTDLGGLPELITAGVEGEVVPADDPAALGAALGKLVADPDRAYAMGRCARAKIDRDFTPQLHLDRLRDAYLAAALSAPAGTRR